MLRCQPVRELIPCFNGLLLLARDLNPNSGGCPLVLVTVGGLGVEFMVVFAQLGDKKLGIIEGAMRKQQC